MTKRKRILSAALAVVGMAAVLFASSALIHAQQKPWTPRMTPWGHPDLQGIWNASAEALTPLERPTCKARPDVCNQRFVTDAEYRDRITIVDNQVAVAEGTAVDSSGLITSRWQRLVGGVGAHIWNEATPSRPSRRTSKIVDPPDGRIPPYSAEGQKRREAEAAQSLKARRERGGAAESAAFWASKTTSSWFNALGVGDSRCLSKSLPTAYMAGYSANLQILQTPNYVAMAFEMYHEVRIIWLDGRPHLPSAIRDSMGDSRGHWEGNTLVVEAQNFPERVLFGGDELVSENYRVTERFTRVDEGRINHEITIVDPGTWTKPITLEIDHYKDGKQTQILEFACHEGNYEIFNAMIGGIRALDAEANASQKKAPGTAQPQQ